MTRSWCGCWCANWGPIMIDLDEGAHTRRRADNMLPAINVIFLLLLFFMVAGSVTEGFARNIFPPRSHSAAPLSPAVEEFVLPPGGGALQLDGQSVTVADWAAELARDGVPVPRVVRLRADAREPAGRLIALLDAFREVGVARVGLVTLGEAGRGRPASP